MLADINPKLQEHQLHLLKDMDKLYVLNSFPNESKFILIHNNIKYILYIKSISLFHEYYCIDFYGSGGEVTSSPSIFDGNFIGTLYEPTGKSEFIIAIENKLNIPFISLFE